MQRFWSTASDLLLLVAIAWLLPVALILFSFALAAAGRLFRALWNAVAG